MVLHTRPLFVCLPGRFDVWDIFSNKAAGSLELTAIYQPSQHEAPIQEAEALAATATTAAAAAESKCDSEEQELLIKLSVLSQQQEEDTAGLPAGAVYPRLLPKKHTVLLCTGVRHHHVTAIADWGHGHCAKQQQQ